MTDPTDSKLFLTRHYPTVAKALGGGGAGRVFGHVQQFIGSDRVMAKLEVNHPGESVYFGPDDLDPIYTHIGVSEDELRKTIRDCPVIGASWRIVTKPYFWATLLALRYFDASRRPEQEMKMLVMMLAVLFYGGPGLQYKFFRRFHQENAMGYAMHTLSDKFTLKQEGTMFAAILAIAWRSHEKYAPQLRAGDDLSLRTYLVSMWSRLNGMVKSLKNQYEQTRAKGAYLNQSRDRHDDGELAERETDGGKVDAATDRFAEAFFGEPLPPRAVDIAAQMADTPRQSLLLAANEIRGGSADPIREIFRLISELFFEESKTGPEGFKTRNFLLFANAVYARSNTIDGRIERVKQILDELLRTHSPNYMRTNREATRGSFRKGLYLLFVVFMQLRS